MSEAPITAADIETWARVERALKGKSGEMPSDIQKLADEARAATSARKED